MAKDKDRPLSSLDRAILQAMGDGREVGNVEDPAKDKWPSLWEWMSRIYTGRDYMMTPASLSVRLVTAGVNITISNRDLGQSVSINTQHLGDVFDIIDKALADPSTPMMTWGKKEPTLRKRKKSI